MSSVRSASNCAASALWLADTDGVENGEDMLASGSCADVVGSLIIVEVWVMRQEEDGDWRNGRGSNRCGAY